MTREQLKELYDRMIEANGNYTHAQLSQASFEASLYSRKYLNEAVTATQAYEKAVDDYLRENSDAVPERKKISQNRPRDFVHEEDA